MERVHDAASGEDVAHAYGAALHTRERAILQSFAARIDAEDAGAHNNLGVLYFTKGLIDAAADEFAHALDRDPKMTVAQRNLEIACMSTGLYGRRVSELTERIAQGDAALDARRSLARLHLLLGEHADAITQFDALVNADPTDAEALKSPRQAI